MGKFKNLGIILTSTAFTVSLLSPISQASANVQEPAEKIEIKVASAETNVTKGTLIKKVHELFPGKFDFVTENDFHLGRGHYFRNDKTIRYDLSFHKTVNDKDLYGSFTFMGNDLELESFYYQPANIAEAIYPAKYSEAEAQKLANDFLKKLPNTEGYQLQQDVYGYSYYYNIARPLSEPITYSFMYAPTHNNVPIMNKQISIDVLANGEISSFYRYSMPIRQATFDPVDQKKDEAGILAQLQENLSVELRYTIDYDYKKDEQVVKLVYVPSSGFNGVHALSGQWQSANGFTSQVPKVKAVEKLSAQPLAPRKKDMTVAEVEEFVKSLLKESSDKGKLEIDMVDEREDGKGGIIYSVHYSYIQDNGNSFGTSLEMDKATGEIVHYYDLSNELSPSDENAATITRDAALTKAIDYLKEYAPSSLHKYSKPIDEVVVDRDSKDYTFTFPRVVNELPVNGDEITVTIGHDGSLRSMFISNPNIQNWPSVKNVIPAEQAKELYSEALKLKLQYIEQNADGDKQHYDLVYTPNFNGNSYNMVDATTGKWLITEDDSKEVATISHPTAANELNYLLQQNILEVKDPASFNADQAVTKGEALKILLNSLTYGHYFRVDEDKQSFGNIDKEHPLYSVVEQAVKIGMLKPANQFAEQEQLSRQELAEWYIKLLRLDYTAKYNDIYKLNFADASSISPEYAGYIAIANAMGLIDAQQNNFNATAKVTYADLAISAFRLARAIQENNININY
ncbi:S-layer homology domain-containing protein [Lysinibacillus macroides]|uniref:Uncharacterized protein n=1 Tax=Lysinibacillus macroides TaxID=33935 RepID=A0A0M9DJ71_9BACI|nr:YcdB/YcdC domain-containing protein [Lysinibacillus macroides]KOY81713.1 hypothetical protein ADM90_12355 [Lysinibacillus macroides]QPR67820.1 S-layer homology domain-containing protein [Lysinibacillus macroides]